MMSAGDPLGAISIAGDGRAGRGLMPIGSLGDLAVTPEWEPVCSSKARVDTLGMTSSGKLVAIAFFGAALVALGVWRNGGWALLWPLAAIGVLGIAWVLKARLPEGWRNWAGVTSTQLLFLGAVVAVLLVAGVEVPLWWEVLWIVTWGLAGQCITTFD